MAILRYIPIKKQVIDKRSEEGGFYEAECDECHNPFYPKRSNARYCSRSCLVMSYRKKNVGKVFLKQSILSTVLSSKELNEKIKIKEDCAGTMSSFLKRDYPIETEKKPAYKLILELKSIPSGQILKYSNLIVYRRSANRFILFKDK
jgi:hypothetical protein